MWYIRVVVTNWKVWGVVYQGGGVEVENVRDTEPR